MKVKRNTLLLIAALRRGAARQFDSHYAPWGMGGLSSEDENYGGIAIDLAALRAWTAAEENFSLNLAMFCPNGDGTFTAFQPIASIAGGSGQDFRPYVFLLTTDGTVEYIDIFSGLWLGYLCSGGPLYGFRDIVGFESGVYEDGFGGGYETVYAVDKNGRKYDMPACITAQGNAMPSYAAGKWCANVYHSVASGASYEGVYYLSIHENGLVEINDVIVSIDAPLQIAGYCTYLGTTELGMVYQFGLYSGDQLREGAFALDLYNTDYGEMTITPISGVNLFDAPEGGCTVFTRL